MQCYNPHDKVRRQYPKYLFVSDKGNFVSIYNANKPKLLKPAITSNNRESYNLSVEGHCRKSLGYIVVAVCHGAKTFGKADEMMEKKGRLAFGQMKCSLQVHHEHGYKVGDRAYNNDPTNLTILTVNIHQLFQKVPSEKATNKEVFEFMVEFAKRITEETDQPVIMIPSGDGIGTIQTIENDTHLFKLVDGEWIIIPMGEDICSIFSNKAYANIIKDTLIEYCNDLARNTQIITAIQFNETIIPCIVCRKSVQ